MILDFEPEDILESGLRDRFDSVGFTPGLRFDVPTGPVTSCVYSIGATAEAKIPKKAGEWISGFELWSPLPARIGGAQLVLGGLAATRLDPFGLREDVPRRIWGPRRGLTSSYGSLPDSSHAFASSGSRKTR